MPRARSLALSASVAAHSAALAVLLALPPGAGRTPVAPPRPGAVEVRLFAPRLAAIGSAAPRARPGAGFPRSARPRRAPSASRAAPRRPLSAPAPLAGGHASGEGGVPFAGAAEVGVDAPLAWAPPPAAAPRAIDADWLERHQRHIERRLQFTMNTRPYPPDARRRGWRGAVVVAFRLGTDGRAREARVVRSSGHDVLHRCAVEAVLATPRFPRPPVDVEVEVPFEFRLAAIF